MSKIWAVYKRELGLYFRSPVAYGVAFALLLLFGLLFSSNLSQVVNLNLQTVSDPTARTYAADDLLGQTPGLLTFLLFLVAPLLTMRLIAEEAREGTLETLMTLPINESAFIIGKFLAVWTYYTIILLLVFVYHLILATLGTPDLGLTFGTYFGAWLYGGAVLAVCLIWSAVTEDQIVAAFLAAATVLVLYLASSFASGDFSRNAAPWLVDFVRELSLTAHYSSTMANGILRAEDVLYFVFLMIASLFITTRIVETRRWRS
jgi:ABC-2 type transport system permease protein